MKNQESLDLNSGFIYCFAAQENCASVWHFLCSWESSPTSEVEKSYLKGGQEYDAETTHERTFVSENVSQSSTTSVEVEGSEQIVEPMHIQ